MLQSRTQIDGLLGRKMTRKEFLGFGMFSIAAAFGIIGLIRELESHASTPTASLEPENGTGGGGATAVSDSTASGGAGVKFNTASTGTITHGSQITPTNTGYTAYYDNTLGRNLQLSDLQVISGVHYVSDYVSAGGTLTKKHFTGSVIIDVNNVTLRGCLFDNPVSGYLNGNNATG